MEDQLQTASPLHIKKQKGKARLLRKTRWWREKTQKGVCHHCRKIFPPDDLTMDHLVPLSRGGRTGRNNAVPSCKPCNTKKAALSWMDFNSR